MYPLIALLVKERKVALVRTNSILQIKGKKIYIYMEKAVVFFKWVHQAHSWSELVRFIQSLFCSASDAQRISILSHVITANSRVHAAAIFPLGTFKLLFTQGQASDVQSSVACAINLMLSFF